MEQLKKNAEAVRARVEAACARSGRNPDDIQLIAVTKTHPPEVAEAAASAGLHILGENRVQEAAAKIEKVRADVSWHLIGHLQSNKARKAAPLFDMIQSVDSMNLANKLNAACGDLSRRLPILVQVNTSGERSKFGVAPEAAADLVAEIAAASPHLLIEGLMTIGPLTDEPQAIRRAFVLLRRLREEIAAARIEGVQMLHLSMGMTDDFEIAIEEGSTMIRLGRVLFGARAF